MKIFEAAENKRQYLDLLLLADESEAMIERYLYDGTMFVLEHDGIKAECVVLDIGGGVLELKNIAVVPQYQRRGYGSALLEFLSRHYLGEYDALTVGTGDVPSSIGFYESAGFARSGVIKNFFTDNYDHEMIEDGIKLVDMVYLSKKLR